MKVSSMFDGNLGKYLLPGIVLQSVMIGGGYATGREIVEYGAKFGAYGWYAGLGIMAGFALVAVLCYELIRLYHVYDYKSFIQSIAGPLYPVFDLVYTVFMVIILAVMSSATGAVVQQMFGVSHWFGVVGIMVVAGLLNFYGEKVISFFETFGTVALYVGYLTFSVLVISGHTGNIAAVMASSDHSYVPDATMGHALWTGLLYMACNLVVFPASFFTVKKQTKRKESVVSGIVAGLLATIPWFLTYFSVMGFYPSKEVLGAQVPWMVMMQESGAPSWLMVAFSFIMGWTLVETATGMIHALLERVDKGLEEKGRTALSRRNKGLTTVVIMACAVALAQVGIIDLIAKGYMALAYAFMALFLLPLLTVGVYKIFQKEEGEEMETEELAADCRQKA